MASNKRSARAKQRAAFEAGLGDGLSAGGMDDLFAREHAREERIDAEHAAALRHKACESKNRYASRPEAEAALIFLRGTRETWALDLPLPILQRLAPHKPRAELTDYPALPAW